MVDTCKGLRWLVNWDNGGDACGTFHYRFATRAEAQSWGDEWAKESAQEWELGPDDEQPHAEAIEVPCPGCADCCAPECKGCAECHEPEGDYAGMGWIGKDGQP